MQDNYIKELLSCLEETRFPTIVKHRYLTRNAKREEYKKIFAITNIPEKMCFDEESAQKFKEGLREKI